MFSKLAIFLSLIIAACGVTSVNALPSMQNGTIKWFPCHQNGTVPVSCGTLTVPLDYSDPTSNKTLELSLVKVSAVKQPKKGSILLNQGGPGFDTNDLLNGPFGEQLFITTGGFHDVISFSPRGTGTTMPYSCFKSDVDRATAGLITPSTTNTSDTALGTMWALRHDFAETCFNNAREDGELVGTAFVARDMMQIVDALQEDGLLRYWGFSYGTILGVTAAAMFPDRMDKIVLDGVVNPTQYYEGHDIEEITDSDAVLSGFFKGCVAAGAASCPLACPQATAASLEEQVFALLDKVKFQPFPALSAAGVEANTIIDYGLLKTMISSSLETPAAYPVLATILQDLLHGNTTSILDLIALSAESSTAGANFAEIEAAVRCGDNSLRAKSLTEVLPIIDELYATSKFEGDIEATVTVTCANWRISAKERYESGFNDIKTKNPMLFVGNTFDPLTPLISARNASAAFPGSSVIQHDGFGHTSIVQPSLCTAKAIRAYFVNGTLPPNGLKCEPDIPLFSNETALQALAPLNVTTRGLGGDGSDAELLNVVKLMGRKMRGSMFSRG